MQRWASTEQLQGWCTTKELHENLALNVMALGMFPLVPHNRKNAQSQSDSDLMLFVAGKVMGQMLHAAEDADHINQAMEVNPALPLLWTLQDRMGQTEQVLQLVEVLHSTKSFADTSSKRRGSCITNSDLPPHPSS